MSPAQPAPDDFTRILRTDELRARFTREPDFESENRALVQLAQALSATPRQILGVLADTILDLCTAGSAGINILDSETGGDRNLLRWRAVSGVWARYQGTVEPWDFSPCAAVISANCPQLMTEPALYYDCIRQLDPPCHELLLVPFHIGADPVGTIWAASHDRDRHFDAEDARLLTSLANFTSGAYQLLRAQESLEAYGRERTAEVTSLADANKSKDEFIATIAHELRNPLGPIRTSSKLLVRAASDPGLVRRAAEVIERQASSMSRLIDDLLDVSRVRRGVLELQSTQVELGEVLRSALEASRLVAEPTSHQVQVEICDTLRVLGDPLRLAQILENLLNNAAKYTDTNGIVTIRLFQDGGDAVVSISDTGIGIEPAQLESIFELFAQGGQAGTPRSRGGLGIGLHLAKQLVESHHGTLTAASEGAGRGSTFTVRIPCIC